MIYTVKNMYGLLIILIKAIRHYFNGVLNLLESNNT